MGVLVRGKPSEDEKRSLREVHAARRLSASAISQGVNVLCDVGIADRDTLQGLAAFDFQYGGKTYRAYVVEKDDAG